MWYLIVSIPDLCTITYFFCMHVGNALVHGCAIEKMALTLMKLEALIFTLLEDKAVIIGLSV